MINVRTPGAYLCGCKMQVVGKLFIYRTSVNPLRAKTGATHGSSMSAERCSGTQTVCQDNGRGPPADRQMLAGDAERQQPNPDVSNCWQVWQGMQIDSRDGQLFGRAIQRNIS